MYKYFKSYRKKMLLTIIVFFATALSLEAQNWQNIPINGTGGEPLFNYATMLSRTILFYDANRCGKDVAEDSRFNWRGDCHVNDGVTVTLSDGTEHFIDARGGYHDAGDHIKFGITNAYAAATLGWGFYEFRRAYEATGQDVWLLRAVKWATDYFIRCHPEPDMFLYSVGSNDDHNYWGPPELQSDITSPRDIVIATPTHAASDVLGSTAAALALMSLNYRHIDADYADLCLQHAKDLYALGRNTLGLSSDNMSYYPPSIFWDDLAWGAVWLYEATKDPYYEQEFKTIIGPQGANLDPDGNIENGIAWDNQWVHCWDAVWGGAFAAAAKVFGHPAYIEQVKLHLDHWVNDVPESPAGLKYLSDWGSLRYSTAAALEALSFYNSFPTAENEIYRRLGASQVNYAVGANPLKRCYIVGVGNNPPRFPHHDAAHGSDNGFLDEPPVHKHVLYGALCGGPGMDDQHNDATDDFVQNEVSIDYNAAIVGALAGMISFYGDGLVPDPDPAPEPPIEGIYVEARVEENSASRTQVTVHIHNHTVHPPHFETQLSYRYYLDLSEVFDQGYDLSNLSIQTVVNEKSEGTLSGLNLYDEINHIYYIDVSYQGVALYNKREFQFGIIFTTPNFEGQWDGANDFSFQGLGTVLAKNQHIPVYRNGELIWGREPYKDITPPAATANVTGEATGSSQVKLDWTDNIDTDIAGYNIYRSHLKTFTPGPANLVGTSLTSDFTDTELTALTTYYYQVTAFDTSLNESPLSHVITVTTREPDRVPPAQVMGLTLTAVTDETVTLNWRDNSDPDLSKYRVFRSTSAVFNPEEAGRIGDAFTSSYKDTGLNPNTTYYYIVAAVDTSNNQGEASSAVSGTTDPPPPPALKVQYRAINQEDSATAIRFAFHLYNEDTKDLAIADLKVRYWFTPEDPSFVHAAYCDYADVGQANLTFSFGVLGDNHYLDIGFTALAKVPTWLGGDGKSGTFPAGAQTGEIQVRFMDDKSTKTDQRNDVSFDGTKAAIADHETITAYYQDTILSWGRTPGGEPSVLLGDVNGSGTVDMVDARMTAQFYVGLNPPGFDKAAGDVNSDGSITIVDALMIARYYEGLIRGF